MESFIKTIIVEAGDVIMTYFGNDPALYFKGEGSNDFATEADLASQKIIIGAIEKHYPDHGIVGEEAVGHGNDEGDPVDAGDVADLDQRQDVVLRMAEEKPRQDRKKCRQIRKFQRIKPFF